MGLSRHSPRVGVPRIRALCPGDTLPDTLPDTFNASVGKAQGGNSNTLPDTLPDTSKPREGRAGAGSGDSSPDSSGDSSQGEDGISVPGTAQPLGQTSLAILRNLLRPVAVGEHRRRRMEWMKALSTKSSSCLRTAHPTAQLRTDNAQRVRSTGRGGRKSVLIR